MLQKTLGAVLVFGTIAIILALTLYLGVPVCEKLDRSLRQEGYSAAQDGIPPEACPYAPTSIQQYNRTLWMEGWQQGKRDVGR